MNARQLIEAEDPKGFIRHHAPRTPRYYRFALADGGFCFSVVAFDEQQAIDRAQQLISHIGPSWKLWDSQYIDATAYVPEVDVAAENILAVDNMEDIFNDPEEAAVAWEEEFKALIA